MFSINNVLNRRSFLVGATLIFAPIYYTPASVLLKNAKDMSYDMTLMGVDGMDGLCDPGRQVHRRLSAHKARPVRLDMRLSSQISSGFGYPTGHPSPCSAFAKY